MQFYIHTFIYHDKHQLTQTTGNPAMITAGNSKIKSGFDMTDICPVSLLHTSTMLYNIFWCSAICFMPTFLGLAEKPPRYYVGNIKSCVATRADVKSVGGL